ncbi:MAG: hypothetical protein MK077_10435, partial [Phycisphaerales bacterium]|nr:hypothetical protein [Phycisphaerales bacterium]
MKIGCPPKVIGVHHGIMHENRHSPSTQEFRVSAISTICFSGASLAASIFDALRLAVVLGSIYGTFMIALAISPLASTISKKVVQSYDSVVRIMRSQP